MTYVAMPTELAHIPQCALEHDRPSAGRAAVHLGRVGGEWGGGKVRVAVRTGRPPCLTTSAGSTWWRNDRRFTPHLEGTMVVGLWVVGVAAWWRGGCRVVHGRVGGFRGEHSGFRGPARAPEACMMMLKGAVERQRPGSAW